MKLQRATPSHTHTCDLGHDRLGDPTIAQEGFDLLLDNATVPPVGEREWKRGGGINTKKMEGVFDIDMIETSWANVLKTFLQAGVTWSLPSILRSFFLSFSKTWTRQRRMAGRFSISERESSGADRHAYFCRHTATCSLCDELASQTSMCNNLFTQSFK